MGPDDSGQPPELPDAKDLIAPERWARLDSYFAGLLPLAERVEMDRWVSEREDRRGLVEKLRDVWERAERVSPEIAPVDIRQVLNTLAERRDAIDAGSFNSRVVEFSGVAPLRRASSSRQRTVAARWFTTAAAAALVIFAVLPRVWHRLMPSEPRTAVAQLREIVTKRAQRAALDLADGSQVILAPDSKLTIPADLGTSRQNGRRRELYLTGKAYFTVRHDSRSPFIVRTATAVTEDIGTEFALSAYPETQATQVAVLAGSVALRKPDAAAAKRGSRQDSVHSRGPAVLLEAGDLGRLDKNGTPTVARNADLASYASWTTGELVFDGTPIRDAIAELSRWYDIDIVLNGNSFDDLRITAEFRNEPVDLVLQRLSLLLRAHASRTGAKVLLTPAIGR